MCPHLVHSRDVSRSSSFKVLQILSLVIERIWLNGESSRMKLTIRNQPSNIMINSGLDTDETTNHWALKSGIRPSEH